MTEFLTQDDYVQYLRDQLLQKQAENERLKTEIKLLKEALGADPVPAHHHAAS